MTNNEDTALSHDTNRSFQFPRYIAYFQFPSLPFAFQFSFFFESLKSANDFDFNEPNEIQNFLQALANEVEDYDEDSKDLRAADNGIDDEMYEESMSKWIPTA